MNSPKLRNPYKTAESVAVPKSPTLRRFPIIVGLVVGLFATPIAMFLWTLSASEGHGDYLLASVIYPIPMIPLAIAAGLFPFSLTLAAMQFPVYGAFIGSAYSRGKSHLWSSIALLSTIQIVGAVLVLQSTAFGR